MIYFLSDAHLGSRVMENPVDHQQRLVQLLTEMGKDATEIFLLGDIFDFWYEYVWPTHKTMKRALFGPTLSTLKALTDKGVKVHFFIGNHDIWTWGWLSKETGVKVYKKPTEMVLNGKKCYLAHGDGVVPSNILELMPKELRGKIRAFMHLRRFFHNPIPQFFYALMPPKSGDNFGYNWAKSSRQKELANPYGYKGENKEELILFAKEQEQQGKHHDYYIFGHRHIELDLMLGSGSRVVVLGDFFRQFTYAKMDDNGEVSLMNVEL